jgi:hypothetical protein
MGFVCSLQYLDARRSFLKAVCDLVSERPKEGVLILESAFQFLKEEDDEKLHFEHKV